MARRLLFPPTLEHEVIDRTFRPGGTRDCGFRPEDLDFVFDACLRDSVAIHDSELWIMDHRAAFEGDPIPAKGHWCGLIPEIDSDIPAVWTTGPSELVGDHSWQDRVIHSVNEMRTYYAAREWEESTDPRYLRLIRVNFTFEMHEDNPLYEG
ncbi:MAG: hypothetical protein KDA30_07895 [Phycisphaerales bacterium]|nr:hypothetical protein [Phycisphaerales bacterium]